MTEKQYALLTAHLANPYFLLKKYHLILQSAKPFAVLYQWFGSATEQYCKAAIKLVEHHHSLGIDTLFIDTSSYPPLLSQIDTPPPLLFYKGNLQLLNNLTAGLVGTRQPSLVGLKFSEAISKYLAKRYITIVSGMARGIDSCAHRNALAIGGSTIAVVAHGLDRIYPIENHDLFTQATSNSSILLLSEYPAGIPPLKHHFIRRNRLIAGLSQSLVMVEGAITSGAMITARYALENNRTVFAVDHPAMSANTGGKQLIAQGAENLAKRFILQENSLSFLILGEDSLPPFYLGNQRWATISPQQTELF